MQEYHDLFRSWMNCTVVCTVFFLITFIIFISLFCVFMDVIFFSIHFFMLIIILFWVWKIVLSTLFDYFPNALALFLYITNLQRICCAILIVGLKKESKRKKFLLVSSFFRLWIINNVKLRRGCGFFYGWFYSRIGC